MTPASVVGNGNHDHRDVCSPDPLNEFIQSLDVHVALEGVGGFRVTGFWGDQVDGQAPCVLDVGSGGVEVGVTRDVLARPSYGRKKDFLGCSTLKNIVRMKILDTNSLSQSIRNICKNLVLKKLSPWQILMVPIGEPQCPSAIDT